MEQSRSPHAARPSQEEEIERRLSERPDLLEAFAAGDARRLAELVEVGTGATVASHEVRLPAH